VPTYDIVVIGGGTAGLVAAAGSAGLGARVALVERRRLGGECLWTGCVPSKALLAAAAAAHEARGAARFGVRAASVEVDFGAVMAWVRAAQQRIAPHDSPERFRGLGVDVIEGTARFTGARALAVDGRHVAAKRIVVAAGSRPAVPSIPGLTDAPFHTNETVFELDRLPGTLVVLGAGPIGLEFAQAFARLGSTVHVIDSASRLLPREDEETAGLLRRHLEDEGVHIHLATAATRVVRAGAGVRVEAAGPGGEPFVLGADTLLLATGRSPELAPLELSRAGVDATGEGIAVDRTLRTTAAGVWASGDCVGPLHFTHVADYQSRLVVRNAFVPLAARADYRAVPWVIYTQPELAHVGLTEAEARARHGDQVRVWRRPLAELDRAVTDGHTDGLVKLVTDPRGRILGGHILAPRAGEMIMEVTLAMRRGLPAAALATLVHPYPTYGEATRQAADGFYKSRFTGTARSVARWLARR
jgi:pyruvate/2-oxoglutarate dehydrogenase complex dihydrolipoamide dehydrogenase (E3) component